MRIRASLLAAVGSVSAGVAMAAPPISVPTSYEQTCELVRSWCQPPVPGKIPSALVRPLHLPQLGPRRSCPTSKARSFRSSQFAGLALGQGVVRPLVSPDRPAFIGPAKRGILDFTTYRGQPGWHQIKSLWFSTPSYQGPVFIRGRRLDRPGRIVMGELPSLVDPQLPPGDIPNLNGADGWREWPGVPGNH